MKNLTIPNPCHQDWDKMTPNTKGRFCQSCSKTVIDFTKPGSLEGIENFENICGRMEVDIPDQPPDSYRVKSQWAFSLPQFYRRTVVASLAFISLYLFGGPQAKAQQPVIRFIDLSGTYLRFIKQIS